MIVSWLAMIINNVNLLTRVEKVDVWILSLIKELLRLGLMLSKNVDVIILVWEFDWISVCGLVLTQTECQS